MGVFLVIPVVGYAVWCTYDWFRKGAKLDLPRWRGILAVIALIFGSASAVLYISTAIYAQAIGGFEHYAPVLMRIYACGLLSALVGLFFGVLGKGKLRPASVICSLTLLFLWFSAAITE